MAAKFSKQSGLRRDAGITMIELMIAGVVLIVGFMGIMVLLTTAIAGNSRNRNDSSSTMLAQMTMEQITNAIANGATTRTITDCAGNQFTISAAAGGATLSGSSIDFTASQVGNYSMNYVVCNATGRRATYDVRWNVQSLATGPSLVTVAARPRASTTDIRRFAIPVSLRTMVGE